MLQSFKRTWKGMGMEILILVGVLAGWILLNAVILPRLGVPTCMSGACAAPPRRSKPRNDAGPVPSSPSPAEDSRSPVSPAP